MSVGTGARFLFNGPKGRVPTTWWADTPHVQWQKTLCLYAAPAVEWLPSDGMSGLVDRLIRWLRQAAAGNLDPEGQPLHPPVAYASLALRRAITPPALPRTRTGPARGG